MTEEILTGPDEDSVLAAEHALRLLDGPMRSKAESRMRNDPGFAAQVERWQERLSPLFEQVEPVAPPAGLWDSLQARLGGGAQVAAANDNVATLEQRLRVWRGLTAGAAALAAVCVAALVLRTPGSPSLPVPVTVPGEAPAARTAPLAVAALRGETGAAVVAAYDANSKSLVLTPAVSLDIGKKSAELWLIPAGGKPQSLGLIDPSKPTRIAAPAGVGAAGAALAISVEPIGGSPTGQPTGPVIASGALAVA